MFHHDLSTGRRLFRGKRFTTALAAVLLATTAAGGLAACGRLGGAEAGGWPVVGGSHKEQFYTPLDKINTGNVGQLGLAWFADLDTARGQEANVVVVDGVLYTSTAWSKVYAYEAKTGKQLWFYDPAVPGEIGFNACCDVVNRGVAVSDGKVFVGALDGRLIALDARTGRPVWEVQTTDKSKPYTITGAPRVAKGKVIIGNAGAEYGVRGYVTAYEVATGKQAWRFYTVPGAPDAAPDGAASDPILKTALPSWSGKWHEYGGGGTVWDAIVYDEEFDQLLIGVGNGSPWNYRVRSEGKGDNLFLSSIVALDPDTGAYKWHFQETPGETWDFTATQPIILADLKVDGVDRKVAMQAPKNGFFYVIDRKDGAFISAKNFVSQNWASGIDPKTGRPTVRPEARWDINGQNFVARPGAYGAHAWHPMAYSPKTNLVYIPAQDIPFGYLDQGQYTHVEGRWNLGNVSPTNLGPGNSAQQKEVAGQVSGQLVAWDPVAQKEAWRVQHPYAGNGGVLATGGDLVFQGSPDGSFNAYRADNGQKVWTYDTQNGVIAGASSYEIDGEQYVAVLAGFGGIFSLFSAAAPDPHVRPAGRVLVFKLGGTAALPAYTRPVQAPNPPAQTAPQPVVMAGMLGYANNCIMCHGGQGWSSGVVQDLRRSAVLTDPAAWQAIVHDGALRPKGMIGFAGKLKPEEIETIRLYVGEQARILQHESQADAGAAAQARPAGAPSAR